ncbi:unnamed protein product [Urochloa humidicola]
MPRTRSDFALRIVQAGSAIGAIVAMVSAKDFSSVVPFVIFVATSSLQTLWAFSLAVLNAIMVVTHYPLQNWVASKIIFGDMIIGSLTLAGAAASSGVVLFLRYDIKTCWKEHCTQFQYGAIMAFISFAAMVASIGINYIGR